MISIFVRAIALVLVFFSIDTLAMDPNGLEHLNRLQQMQQNLARMNRQCQQDLEYLSSSMSGLGLNRYSNRRAPNPYPFSSSNFMPMKKKDRHTDFIKLPEELHGKDLVHVLCDCTELVDNGHYCGSHALTHAIDDANVFDSYPLDMPASKLVMSMFDTLGFHTEFERTRAANIMTAAQALKLDVVFLAQNNGHIVANFFSADELPFIRAFKDLDRIREQIKSAGQNTVVKPVFFIDDEHIVLFSVVWDSGRLTIMLNDNLNKPLKVGTPLFKAAQFLTDFFAEDHFTMMTDLVPIFAESADVARYANKFTEYRRRSDVEQGYTLLTHIFDSWRSRTLENSPMAIKKQIAAFNAPMKKLKRLWQLEHRDVVKSMIIECYTSMIDSIDKSAEPVDTKRESLEKVFKAIKITSKEQNIFSIASGGDAEGLFERAQYVQAALHQY